MSRKIDKLIAEHIFNTYVEDMPNGLLEYDACYMEKGRWVKVPNYSTDVSAAWEVVERIGKMSLHYDVGGGLECEAKCHNQDAVREDTMPMAICLAALKTKGIDVSSDKSNDETTIVAKVEEKELHDEKNPIIYNTYPC